MKKILITGGAGFIGSNLVDFFLKKGDKVYVIDNYLTSSDKNIAEFADKPDFRLFEADLIKADLDEILPDQQFDLIYHLASPASPRQYYRFPIETLLVNSQGTYKILEFARKSGSKKIIFASTSEVYGDPKIHPQTEEYWGNVNPVGARSCYDEAKRFGESLCISYRNTNKININIVRIFNTYGPNMEKNDGRVISNFIVQALANRPITVNGNGTQTRSFCYISDLVKGLYLTGENNLTEKVINMGNTEEKTILELAQIILKLTRSSSKIQFQTLPEDDPIQRKPDISKAERLLDWKPTVNLEEGLMMTIAYFKKLLSL